ncbi:MAG: hypothetical protein ACRC2K_12520 [Clostridium sp.]
MWVKCNRKDVLLLNVVAVSIVEEDKNLFNLVGSLNGREYGGVVLEKFVEEMEAKECLNALEKAIENKVGIFDINNYKEM